MEIISGESNWRLLLRREADRVVILRAGTCDRRAVLPDRLFGLPVTELADHALAPDRQPALNRQPAVNRQSAPDRQPAFDRQSTPSGEGEPLLITCGLPDPDAVWDNRNLQDLSLPKSLTAIGSYALLNCSALKNLRLHDSVERWGGAVLMNCRGLDALHLTRAGKAQGEALAWFVGELSRELDVTIESGGETTRLLFPEYTELYEENCPAHHFDYFISGAGYPYHHCFRQKKLQLKEYDALWRDFLAMEHDEPAALRLAWYRLRWPVDLGETAAADYRDYLRSHAGEALRFLLAEEGGEGLPLLLELARPDRAALAAACALARELGATAALAALLEERHRRFPEGLGKTFAL